MLSRFLVRLAISLAALLIAVIAAVIALVYFAYALFLVLLNVVTAPAAAALTGVIIPLAAILLVVATQARPRGRKRGASPSLEGFESAAALGSQLARKIRALTGSEASGGLLAALVAGFAVGMSPKLRAFLQSILKP